MTPPDLSRPMPDDASPRVAVVIVAAGRGERAGQANGPKQYRRIGGKAVLAHTLEAFRAHPHIAHIVVVIHPDDHALFEAAAGSLSGGVMLADGGRSRQQSVLYGLAALEPHRPDIVLIHDGVRPFVDPTLIDRVIAATSDETAALPALPVSDTLKQADDGGYVAATVPRERLHAAQTPQAFPFAKILAAHRRAAAASLPDFTDDAAIAEWAGLAVKLVPGSPDNTKLTWAKDIEMADRRLNDGPRFPDVRTGNGYDVHAFEAGDIGTHFPPSDPQWKGAPSKLFVEHAVTMLRERGGRIANADVTLICEAPKVGPHREAMTAAMAAMLGIAPTRVSIKATTNEKLGFIGRGEGIAAIATATVVYPGELP